MKPVHAVLIASILAATGLPARAAADPEFVDFAVKQAHKLNFKGCDAAIREAFKNAGGKDIRVWTDYLEETKTDQLQLSGAYGNDGDMVFIDAALRKQGGKCLMQLSSVIVMEQSCPSYLSDNAMWKVEASTGDIMSAKNGNGVMALLRPVGRACMVTFRRGVTFKAG